MHLAAGATIDDFVSLVYDIEDFFGHAYVVLIRYNVNALKRSALDTTSVYRQSLGQANKLLEADGLGASLGWDAELFECGENDLNRPILFQKLGHHLAALR